MDFNYIIIEIDSLLVVNWFLTGRCSLWYLEDYWEDIKSLLSTMNFQIQRVFREAIMVADFLAWMGSNGSTEDWQVQRDVPSFLKGILCTDRKVRVIIGIHAAILQLQSFYVNARWNVFVIYGTQLYVFVWSVLGLLGHAWFCILFSLFRSIVTS